jgi:hypothetical protein
VHVDFSVETIPANRKTQSIKFLRNLCHYVPYWDITALIRSFHSILHAERIACRFQRRDNLCKSQNAIFQISTKSLSFSFRNEILRRSYALSTPLYTPNVAHVDFSVETIPANRKMQSFKFLRNLCHLVSDWGPTAFKHSFHSIIHDECRACRFQCRKNPCKSQNAFFQISTKSLSFSFSNEILQRSYALSTPYYTLNVLHVDFSVETISANRKTQSFKFLRNLCHFVPDWDTTAFIRSLHSILHAECSACRFQCRKNPCKSQNATYQISTKSVSFSFRNEILRRSYALSTLF